MATNVTLNGISYSIPALGDSGWATILSAYLTALATGVLTKSGGAFTLTNEVDFGSSFGVKSLYVKSRGSNPSSTGIVRLANAESVAWRNNANSADIALAVNSSDVLTFNNNPILTLSLGAANTVLRMKSDGSGYEYAKIVNDNIDDSAAIAYSKLSLSGSIVNADVNASAAIAYSKLNLSGSIVNADVNASAAIAYSKLNLASSIVDSDIGASAAIARTKIAALTANRVLVSNGSGVDSASSVTATELGYLTGVTSAVQTQIDSKEPTITTLATSKGGTGQNSTAVFPTSGTVVTRTATEALTNKDYDGGTASNSSRITLPKASKSTLDSLTRKEATLVYASDLDKVYVDDGSTLKEIGSSGSSGINYLVSSGKAWNFEDGLTTGWGAYADAAATSPVDGTGGSANVTFAASSSTPLRGTYSGLLTKGAANRQGEGVSVDFTLDNQDIGKSFTFSFDTSASANFTGESGTESARIYCYDVTNAALLPGYYDVAPGSNTARGFFVATSSTSYRFIIHVSGTGTSAWTLKIDNVTVGQLTTTQGNAITDWQTYTPTFNGLGTVTSIVARWRRVGDSIQICGTFTTGTVSGSGIAYMSLPNSYQINTTIVSSNRGFQLGTFSKLSSTTQNIWDAQQSGTMTYDSTAGAGNLLFAIQVDSGSYRSTTPSNIFNNTENHSFVSELIPISQWSSNITMADRAVEEFAYNTGTWDSDNTSAFASGAAGQAMGGTLTAVRTKRVRFNTSIQPTDSIHVEFSENQITWVPANDGLVNNTYVVKSTNSAGDLASGVSYSRVSGTTTDLDVAFGQYVRIANDDSPVVNWPSSNAYWRVRKIAGGALVGFPIGQANIVYDPTALSDAQATLEGKKQYYDGTAYNGGNSPTVTVSGATITIQRGLFIPYKMQDGSWRLKFNVSFTSSTATSITGGQFNITFDGVTYKNVANFNQSVNAWTNATTNIVNYSYATPNTSNILVHFGTYNNFNQTDYECSGDVELNSKPTWAY